MLQQWQQPEHDVKQVIIIILMIIIILLHNNKVDNAQKILFSAL